MDEKLKPFDLFDGLMVDTILMVKYGNSWAHYNIPKLLKNGEIRTYGYLYNFYSNKPNFRMAKGYIRGEEGNQWKWSHQYFYFDRNTAPIWDERILKNIFYMDKHQIKSTKL